MQRGWLVLSVWLGFGDDGIGTAEGFRHLCGGGTHRSRVEVGADQLLPPERRVVVALQLRVTRPHHHLKHRQRATFAAEGAIQQLLLRLGCHAGGPRLERRLHAAQPFLKPGLRAAQPFLEPGQPGGSGGRRRGHLGA